MPSQRGCSHGQHGADAPCIQTPDSRIEGLFHKNKKKQKIKTHLDFLLKKTKLKLFLIMPKGNTCMFVFDLKFKKENYTKNCKKNSSSVGEQKKTKTTIELPAFCFEF